MASTGSSLEASDALPILPPELGSLCMRAESAGQQALSDCLFILATAAAADSIGTPFGPWLDRVLAALRPVLKDLDAATSPEAETN